MPINRTKKILFIHIPKCAGTSIARSLGMFFGDPLTMNTEILYGIDKNNNNVLQSLPLEYYSDYVSESLISEYVKFTVVRNPYDRVLSDYSWKNRGCKTLYDFLILIKNYLSTHTKKDTIKYNKISPNHMLPQYEYIKSDKFTLDHIIKFENIQQDLNDNIDKTVVLKKINTSKHERWEHYFKNHPECISLVNEIYAIDFEKFNYKKLDC